MTKNRMTLEEAFTVENITFSDQLPPAHYEALGVLSRAAKNGTELANKTRALLDLIDKMFNDGFDKSLLRRLHVKYAEIDEYLKAMEVE